LVATRPALLNQIASMDFSFLLGIGHANGAASISPPAKSRDRKVADGTKLTDLSPPDMPACKVKS
jgi:hypothetical protein